MGIQENILINSTSILHIIKKATAKQTFHAKKKAKQAARAAQHEAAGNETVQKNAIAEEAANIETEKVVNEKESIDQDATDKILVVGETIVCESPL